jgi:exosortase K
VTVRAARTLAAGAVLAVAAGAAYALKAFYATASAADLRFVLAPTAWLVEVAGGHRFDWTSGGYLSGELRFLIAPACAGVNFLIVAFVALVLGLVRPTRPAWQNAALLVASAAAAYGTTLLANALRILVAIPLWTRQVTLAGLGGARLHELAGVVVFLGMLLLLHVAARRLARVPVRLWIPLLPYAGVMLVVPLLRGAHRRPEFWGHAAIVAGALLIAAAAASAVARGSVGALPPPAPARSSSLRAPGASPAPSVSRRPGGDPSGSAEDVAKRGLRLQRLAQPVQHGRTS